MHYDYLIVGSGLSGSTIANLLKNAGKKVLVLEKRDDVGGNISTAIQDDIIVHTYGPHIFHTSDKFAWDMFNKNVEVYPFINSPIANCHGEFYHMPFNMNTFHELWGVTTAEEAKAKIAEEVEKEHIDEPKNLEEQAIKLVGRTIYEKLIKGYTEKQWGRD
jgi:UDP-galactopyranose mutase